VQQNAAAGAYSQALERRDSQAIGEHEDIAGRGVVTECRCRVNRPAVPAQIRHDESEMGGPVGGQRRPIEAGAPEAMQQQEGLAASIDFVMKFTSVKRLDSSDRDRLHAQKPASRAGVRASEDKRERKAYLANRRRKKASARQPAPNRVMVAGSGDPPIMRFTSTGPSRLKNEVPPLAAMPPLAKLTLPLV